MDDFDRIAILFVDQAVNCTKILHFNAIPECVCTVRCGLVQIVFFDQVECPLGSLS